MSKEIKIPNGLKNFLRLLKADAVEGGESKGHWIFTVYTTYSMTSFTSTGSVERPTDEESSKSVCGRFQSCLEAYLRLKVEEPYGVSVPLDIEYIRLPSASINDARTHFRASHGWTDGNRAHEFSGLRHSYFIVLDEGILNTMTTVFGATATTDVGLRYMDLKNVEDNIVVTVVDADYDEACEGVIFATASRRPTKGSSDCITFYGYMKTTPRCDPSTSPPAAPHYSTPAHPSTETSSRAQVSPTPTAPSEARIA
ncbi:hypothetical protein ACMFMG_002422 [Clarireedia jacksonii]